MKLDAMQITYRAELGLNEQPIIIAECETASALYDVTTGEYDPDETDICPVSDDGCWPEPPADIREGTR
jgi:hypothetical protein